MLFQIDQDRAVGLAFALRPIIHPKHTRWGVRVCGRLADERNQSRRAAGHAQADQQAGTGLATQRKGHEPQHVV
jgi:hypothetical protein